MKKILATAIAAGAIVTGFAGPASASNSYTGNVFNTAWNGTTYQIAITSAADRWFYMLPSTQIYRCNAAVSIPDGTLINLTNINKLKDKFQKVRLDFYTSARDTITCV